MFELNLTREKTAHMVVDRRLYSLLKVFYFFIFLVLLFFIFKSVSISNRITACKREMSSLRAEIDNDRQKYEVARLEGEWMRNYDQLLLIDRVFEVRTDFWSRVYALARLLPEDGSKTRN